jgi:hypothetical protein
MKLATEPVGKRLSEFIGDGPGKRMSIRAFAEAMRNLEPRPRGSTRAMIHRYLAGKQPPSDFITAAADVLQLNPEWLAFDKGAPTREDAAVAAAGRPIGDVVWEYFVEGCRTRPNGSYDPTFNPPETLRPVALLLWRRSHRAYPHGPADDFQPAYGVGMALFAPLRALALNPALFHDAQLEALALAMMPGVAAAADYIHEPIPEEA